DVTGDTVAVLQRAAVAASAAGANQTWTPRAVGACTPAGSPPFMPRNIQIRTATAPSSMMVPAGAYRSLSLRGASSAGAASPQSTPHAWKVNESPIRAS
ncbi:unnamed protein product, partial [Polarella glacialis]